MRRLLDGPRYLVCGLATAWPVVLAIVAHAIVLLTYLGLRAHYVPLTYDEAASYLRYIVSDARSVFDFSVATNHWLNSLLTRLSYTVFGSSPLALRLPNLIGALIYLACAAAIVGRLRHRGIALGGFVLLTTNPYVLEYFALSRGYGLSIAMLAGSVYVLLRWLEEPPVSARARRGLAWALSLAGGAVAANFSLLSVFLAIAAVAVLRLVWRRGREPAGSPDAGDTLVPHGRHVLVWVLVATWFTALVFSREPVPSERLFEPITVRVVGLFEHELDDVRVLRRDSRDRLRELTRHPGGVWTTGAVGHAWGLRVELPETADRNLARLDVTIGSQVFRRDRRKAGPWRVEQLGTRRRLHGTEGLALPRSGAPPHARAINWRGDGPHTRVLIGYTLATLLSLIALAVVLWGAARTAVALGLLHAGSARILCVALLWVATLAAAPLYLLRRNVQLYFGGTLGLVTDTFGSLVTGSLSEAMYHPAQTAILLAALGVAAVALPLILLVSRHARRSPDFASPTAVLGIVAFAVVQAPVQHWLLETPYPMGRTALYLMPLLLTYIVLLTDAVAGLGRLARIVATVTLTLFAAASASHAVAAANVTHTLDWPRDAATPAMLEAVVRETAAARPRPPIVRIGVEWIFYPAARYYAERQSTAVTRLDIDVVPATTEPLDFLYVEDSSPLASGPILEAFPRARAVLRRAP